MPAFDTPGPFPQLGFHETCVPEVTSGEVGAGTLYPLAPMTMVDAAHLVWVLRKASVVFTLTAETNYIGSEFGEDPITSGGSGEQSMRSNFSGSPFADGEETELIKGFGNINSTDAPTDGGNPYTGTSSLGTNSGVVTFSASLSLFTGTFEPAIVRIGDDFYARVLVEAIISYVDDVDPGLNGNFRFWKSIPGDPPEDYEVSPITCLVFGQTVNIYQPIGAPSGDAGDIDITASEYWSYDGKWNTSDGTLNP